ncbi:MAG: rRNA pseudouridine synthase [Actinomycetota bacterium]|nr:MAG: rRNA pseudouridine synthase [Actinomycetota bacterium]
MSADELAGVRLQKVLAQAGVGSRRACEQLIDAGRVEVDGSVVRVQGMRVDPRTAVVRVDGVRVPTAPDVVVLALNKPKGMLSTMEDDRGRPCVGDLVADRATRLFHVGRLDQDTEGLLLLTNDGELAHRLQHPSHGVQKTYLATVPGPLPRDVGPRLRAGVDLDDGPATVDRFSVIQRQGSQVLVEVVLHEGRKHVVRRLLDAVGHPVSSLVRTKVGPVSLGQQRPGTLRTLGRDELGALYTAAGL